MDQEANEVMTIPKSLPTQGVIRYLQRLSMELEAIRNNAEAVRREIEQQIEFIFKAQSSTPEVDEPITEE